VNKAASKALFDEQVQQLQGEILESRKWRVFSRDFPVLDVAFVSPGRQPLRVQMHAEDWNELPPSIRLLNLEGEWLTNVPAMALGQSNIFNPNAHPSTGKPFICMAGARDYHTHTSHTNDLWDNYKNRPGYDLVGILRQIWLGWLKSTP
jgi:hypothetical protein